MSDRHSCPHAVQENSKTISTAANLLAIVDGYSVITKLGCKSVSFSSHLQLA
jgi:hypothetical protein